MAGIAQTVVREPGTKTPHEYRQRVSRLACAYGALFAASLVGMVLLLWQAQFFVVLAQRSNVETLVLAFLLVFFSYAAFLSAQGALGAAYITYYATLVYLGQAHHEVERRKARALGPPGITPPFAALSAILEQEGRPGQPFRLPIADEAGSVGTIAVNGAEIRHTEAPKDGSNNVLAFFAQQVNHVLRERGLQTDIDIVQWGKIDDEATRQYLGLVRFAQNLERQLGADELWPKVRLTAADCREIERRLTAICPALRSEAFLPDWEYTAEHKLPVIPEPLGLVSLSRAERRVDPVASMGCAVLVVAVLVLVLGLFILFPPWVPGS